MKASELAITIFIVGGITIFIVAQESADSRAVSEQQSQYALVQPIPTFGWSLERDIAIQLYVARNDRVATHTVWRSHTGAIEGDCPSIGYPLPYDTSLTNPWQSQRSYESSVVIGQAEPNGLFASQNSIATWVICVVGGVQAPIYVEGSVTTYPYPVVVSYDTNRVVRVADSVPSVVIERRDAY